MQPFTQHGFREHQVRPKKTNTALEGSVCILFSPFSTLSYFGLRNDRAIKMEDVARSYSLSRFTICICDDQIAVWLPYATGHRGIYLEGECGEKTRTFPKGLGAKLDGNKITRIEIDADK